MQYVIVPGYKYDMYHIKQIAKLLFFKNEILLYWKKAWHKLRSCPFFNIKFKAR